ncbi:MAG: hypothetical protein ACK56F_03600, partial [bacterium]
PGGPVRQPCPNSVPSPYSLLKNSSSGVDSKESIRPAYVAWWVGRYDNPNPTRFLAPIDCYKILPHFNS